MNSLKFLILILVAHSYVLAQVLQPTGGTLTNGSEFLIRWVPFTNVTDVEILLAPSPHQVSIITHSTPNSGEYRWKVGGEGYDLKHYQRFAIVVLSRGLGATVTSPAFTIVEDRGALPQIITPIENEVVYVGDDLKISWKPLVTGKGASNVNIKVRGNLGGEYFSASVPNTGSYTWKVSKSGASQINFTLTVADGASITSKSEVQIMIPNSRRPLAVPVTIKKVVSIEWVSIPNHQYRIEFSNDLLNWSTAFEDTATETNSAALFYEDGSQFFRVYDITE